MPTPTAKPMFRVRRSPIHGTGVFATRRIRRGTRVVEYGGERVSHDEADRRYEHKPHDDNHTFLFTLNARTVIDGGAGGTAARFINHSCEPNCESVIQGGRIYIEAIRTIQPGTELSYDYMIDRDATDPPDIDTIFACRCGSAHCRGTMLLPPKKRRPRRKAAARAAGGRSAKGKSKAKSKTKSKAKTGSRAKSKPQPRTSASARRRSA